MANHRSCDYDEVVARIKSGQYAERIAQEMNLVNSETVRYVAKKFGLTLAKHHSKFPVPAVGAQCGKLTVVDNSNHLRAGNKRYVVAQCSCGDEANVRIYEWGNSTKCQRCQIDYLAELNRAPLCRQSVPGVYGAWFSDPRILKIGLTNSSSTNAVCGAEAGMRKRGFSSPVGEIIFNEPGDLRTEANLQVCAWNYGYEPFSTYTKLPEYFRVNEEESSVASNLKEWYYSTQ